MSLFDPNPWDDEEEESFDPVEAAAQEALRQAEQARSVERYSGPPRVQEVYAIDRAAVVPAGTERRVMSSAGRDPSAIVPTRPVSPSSSESAAPADTPVLTPTPTSDTRPPAPVPRASMLPSRRQPTDRVTIYDREGKQYKTMTRAEYEEQQATYPYARETTEIWREEPDPAATPPPTASTTRPTSASSVLGSSETTRPAEGRPTDIVTIESETGGRLQVERRQVGDGPGQYSPQPGRGGYRIVDDPAASASTVQTAGTDRPIDSLVRMAGRPAEESKTVLSGIGALLRGDTAGAWTEPYLNDTARLAWARENQAQGRNVDPRDAPMDYVESWKDAFFGSDHSVPLVKELNQQMIDHAVDRSGGPGRPFNWKEAFGETGENGLISTQVASNDCGPNAFSVILRSRGYNADPASVFTYAKEKGYHNGEEFTGPYNMARMLREEAGVQATATPIDWGVIDRELAAGRPVLLSSGGHYWAISARRDGPNGSEYYAGATASTVSNPEWARPGALRYGGAPNVMILASGDVDPQARVVQQLGLKPPTGSGPRRELLSQTTNAQVNASIRSAARPAASTDPVEQLAFTYASQEEVDPVLVMAVIGQESGGDQRAVSRAGARGLMQLMPETAREMGVDPNNPDDNVRGGVRYLKRMLDRYNGNIDLALAAYNAGPGAVDAAGGIPENGETEYFVPAVKRRMQELLRRYTGG